MQILAISTGWKVKGPILIQSLEPLISAPKIIGSTSSSTPMSPMVNL